MVYFFYGEDDFRLKRKIDAAVIGYRQKHRSGLNFGIFDLTRDGEWGKLKIFLDSCSMFAEKKMAAVSGLFEAASGVKEKFLTYLSVSDILKTEESFLMIGQPLNRSSGKKNGEYVFKTSEELFKKLTELPVKAENFVFLRGAKLTQWIKKEVGERGGRLQSRAAEALAFLAGDDLWRLSNEIDKLISYRAGQEITAADIEELAGIRTENDIFKTVDALAARNGQLSFELLHRHLAAGETEIYLLAMLIYQFRNLLLVKEQAEKGTPFGELGGKIKLHPFVLRKSWEQSKNFSWVALKKNYERLTAADIGIKSGRLEPSAALDLVIREIVS